MESRTVSQYLTQQLMKWEVQRVYGVAGDALFPWLDELGKQNKIRFISTRHEAAAAMMASAEAKLTQKPAVCIATSGPGTVNLLNGLADAQKDHVPVVAITGQVDSRRIGSHYKQYMNQQEVLAAFSHYSAEVVNPDQLAHVLHRAFVTAAQRSGVTHISICKDVLAKTTTLPLLDSLPRTTLYPHADRSEMEVGLEKIRKSHCPLILLGNGSRQTASWAIRLAEQLGAGIMLSLGAKGAILDDHPLVLGGVGEGGSLASMRALQEADTLLILGATWFPQSFIPNHVSLIQVDEKAESIHAASNRLAVISNLREVLPFWIRKLEEMGHQPNANWSNRVQQLHREYQEETEIQTTLNEQAERVRPEQLIRAIQLAVNEDAIIAVDTGEHTIWFNRMFRATRQLPLFSGKWRTMGYALPAGIAAKLVRPDKQVVVLTGDGGIQMNLAELMTLKQLGLTVTIVISNNQSLGLEEVKMAAEGYAPFGTELTNPDFAGLAKSCGLNSYRVERANELEGVLKQAFQSEEASVIDVFCTKPTLHVRKSQLSASNEQGVSI